VLAGLGLAMAIYLISVREPRQAHLENIQEKSMASNSENGIVTIPSRHSVEQTVQKLEGILQAKGVKLFALVDHSGEAEKVGMQMRPSKLLSDVDGLGRTKNFLPELLYHPQMMDTLFPVPRNRLHAWQRNSSGHIHRLCSAVRRGSFSAGVSRRERC
jgi:hypothetical protein